MTLYPVAESRLFGDTQLMVRDSRAPHLTNLKETQAPDAEKPAEAGLP